MGSVSSRTSYQPHLSSSPAKMLAVVFLCALAATANAAVDEFGIQNYFGTLAQTRNFALEEAENDLPGVPAYTVAGSCANVKTVDAFNYNRYSGKWYWSNMIENPFLGGIHNCIESEYQFNPKVSGFNVRTSGRTTQGEEPTQATLSLSLDLLSSATRALLPLPGITAVLHS